MSGKQAAGVLLVVLFGLLLCVGTGFADTNQSGNISNSAPGAPSAFTPTSTQNSTPTLTWTRGSDDNGDGVRTWLNVTLSDNTTLVAEGVTTFGTQGTSDTYVFTLNLSIANSPYTVTMWSEDNSTEGALNSSATVGTLSIIPPNAPTNPVPANGSFVHVSTVNLTWTTGTSANPFAILKDNFQWCGSDATCSSPSTTSNATSPITESSLVQDTEYYWRVQTCDFNSGGCSDYIEAAFTFRVNNTEPGVPSAFAPSSSHNGTLYWTRGTDADSDQVRTWYNATFGGGFGIEVNTSAIQWYNPYITTIEDETSQSFNLSKTTQIQKLEVYTIGSSASVTVTIYHLGSPVATATQMCNYGYNNFTFAGETLVANATYGAYTAKFNTTANSTILLLGSEPPQSSGYAGGKAVGGSPLPANTADYMFVLYGTTAPTSAVSNTATAYGTQGTADTVTVPALVYGTQYTVNMWSEDDFAGGTKNSTFTTGTFDYTNTQPTAPSLNTTSNVFYAPAGNSMTMTWTNGTDSDTLPTDSLTHYWQVASDSGYTAIVAQGYKVDSATQTLTGSATANTTFYWRVKTSDNTGASNENSTWATGSFVILEHQPYYVGSSFTMTDDDGGTGGFQVNPVEAGDKTVFMNATFFSAKGYADLANSTFTITKSGSPFKTVSDVSLVQVDSTSARAHITFTMGYNETPQLYNVTVTAKNADGTSQATGHADAYTFTSLTAYTVPTGDISYGTVLAGANSSVQTMTIRNTGNVAFNPNISGSDLTGTATLPASTVWYGTVPSQTIQLSNSPQLYGSSAPVYTGVAESNELDLGWKWVVPNGTLAGTYSGTITIATS